MRRDHVAAGEVPGMDLRALAQAAERLRKARADEDAALNAIADAILDAHPARRKLLTVENITKVPRTTLRRRLHDRTIARREARS